MRIPWQKADQVPDGYEYFFDEWFDEKYDEI